MIFIKIPIEPPLCIETAKRIPRKMEHVMKHVLTCWHTGKSDAAAEIMIINDPIVESLCSLECTSHFALFIVLVQAGRLQI